jgi:hypothetical protein
VTTSGTSPSTALVPAHPVFTDAGRLTLAGFLAVAGRHRCTGCRAASPDLTHKGAADRAIALVLQPGEVKWPGVLLTTMLK